MLRQTRTALQRAAVDAIVVLRQQGLQAGNLLLEAVGQFDLALAVTDAGGEREARVPDQVDVHAASIVR